MEHPVQMLGTFQCHFQVPEGHSKNGVSVWVMVHCYPNVDSHGCLTLKIGVPPKPFRFPYGKYYDRQVR